MQDIMIMNKEEYISPEIYIKFLTMNNDDTKIYDDLMNKLLRQIYIEKSCRQKPD